MPPKRTILFLILAVAFATAHYFAGLVSLYWYLWWFDILMHFWGGILIGLGVYVFLGFSAINLRPKLWHVLLALLVVTISWEIFENIFGLYNPVNYQIDTMQDILIGFVGGLLAHFTLRAYTMK